MGRQLEATQFLATEFQEWASATTKPEKSPAKTKAFELLTTMLKDSKSEVRVLGLDNIRRIRVLHDSDDKEFKNITLKFEAKDLGAVKPVAVVVATAPRNVPRKPFHKKPITLVIPDVRARCISELTKGQEICKDILPEHAGAIGVIIEALDTTDFTEENNAAIIREMVLTMFDLCRWREETDLLKSKAMKDLFLILDLVHGLISTVSRMPYLFDRGELNALVKRLNPPARRPVTGPPAPPKGSLKPMAT